MYKQKLWIEPMNAELAVHHDIKRKKTARCPVQYILQSTSGEKYLLVIGCTDIQKYYIERSVRFQKNWADRFFNRTKNILKINTPLYFWHENDSLMALYRFFSDFQYVSERWVLSYLDEIYGLSNEVDINEENIKLLIDSFLNAWPPAFHEQIRQLKTFHKYRNSLRRFHKLRICVEHGDFTANNLIRTGDGSVYLLDFEFTKENQPLGLDRLDFERTAFGLYKRIEYQRLNETKYLLMEEINCMIDGTVFSPVPVYEFFIKNKIRSSLGFHNAD